MCPSPAPPPGRAPLPSVPHLQNATTRIRLPLLPPRKLVKEGAEDDDEGGAEEEEEEVVEANDPMLTGERGEGRGDYSQAGWLLTGGGITHR